MTSITINGLQTRYYTAGQGEKDVLFIHGWASSGRMWLRSMWALRKHYRLWALDLPGCGDSAGSEDVEWYSIERMTDQVAAFCRVMGIRPYGVIGHSMGGRIAFDLACRYPDYAEKLVAISPSITGRLAFLFDLRLVNGLLGAALNLSRRIWPIATAEVMTVYRAPRYLGSEAVNRSTEDLRRTRWEAAVGSARALVSHDYSPSLPGITHPTLVLCGQQDGTIPPTDSRLAAALLPQAQLVMLDGVHHQLTDEVPRVYLDALRAFLDNGQLA